jgi:hypothetical protein
MLLSCKGEIWFFFAPGLLEDLLSPRPPPFSVVSREMVDQMEGAWG